jgi:hypothetical protein
MASDRVIDHLRGMAGVARELAEEAATPESRHMMLKLAADYEAMALRARDGGADGPGGPPTGSIRP